MRIVNHCKFDGAVHFVVKSVRKCIEEGDCMRIYEYGEPNAKNVLLQPVGDHDLPAIENEIREIKRMTAQPFRLIAVKVER